MVKGIDYKQGQVPTMMIAVASKENWNEKKGVKAAKEMVDSSTKPTPPAAQSKEAATVALPTPPKPAADAAKVRFRSCRFHRHFSDEHSCHL